MRNFKMFRSLQKLHRLQGLRNCQLHTSPSTPQTWSHFQFLRLTRNSSLKSPTKVQKPSKVSNISAGPPNPSPSPRIALYNTLTPPQPSKMPRNRVFYSTCSDKPPNESDCTPKSKKCPEKSSCSEKSYEKSCPDYRDQASCSTNKPKCPDKCPTPPKPKPCPPPEKKSCSKLKPKTKSCSPPEDRSICVKPPTKSSGCGGGKPPPYSRSYSSCTAAEISDDAPGLTFGERQRRKIQEFCSKRKGTGTRETAEKNIEGVSENAETFADKLKREQEEMAECLKKTITFSELSYTRIHCKEYIEDIISTDAKRFLRELDPYSGILRENFTNVSSKPEDRILKKKINWFESLLIQ